jgi:hypothetical protein
MDEYSQKLPVGPPLKDTKPPSTADTEDIFIPPLDENRLETYVEDLSKRVKEDDELKRFNILVGCSAWNVHPINGFLLGTSSIGKTYNVVEAMKYFPQDYIWYLGGLSPTALVHDYGRLFDKDGVEFSLMQAPRRQDPDFKDEDGKFDSKAYREARMEWEEKIKDSYFRVDLHNKILVFLEAPSEETFMRLRPILSHDVEEISFKFTEKGGGGNLRTSHVKLSGWPATLFCTTDTRQLAELSTRSFTISPEASRSKFQQAIELRGRRAARPWEKEMENLSTIKLRERMKNILNWNYYADEIMVPFMEDFAQAYEATDARDMRDHKYIEYLIQSSAIMHWDIRPIIIADFDPRYFSALRRTYIVADYTDLYNAVVVLINAWEAIKGNISPQIAKCFEDVIVPLWEATSRDRPEGLLYREIQIEYDSKGYGTVEKDTIAAWCRSLNDIGWVELSVDDKDKRLRRVKVTKMDKNNALLYAIRQFKLIFGQENIKQVFLELSESGIIRKLSIIKNYYLQDKPIVIYERDKLNFNWEAPIIQEVFGSSYFSELDKIKIDEEFMQMPPGFKFKTIKDRQEESAEAMKLSAEERKRFRLRRQLTGEQKDQIRAVISAARECCRLQDKQIVDRNDVYGELKETGIEWDYLTYDAIVDLAVDAGYLHIPLNAPRSIAVLAPEGGTL